VLKGKTTILAGLLAITAVFIAGCSKNGADVAATVNGRPIKMELVEKILKAQTQNQAASLSPLELAQARLQILESLIRDEVLFQKAEREGTVPTDEEVMTELNRLKTSSGKTQEQFEKDLAAGDETEASLKDSLKKQLAVKKLEDKIAGTVTPPKEAEIVAFYEGNKAGFVRKKGVKLAAIVVDPSNQGEGDPTKNEAEAVMAYKEIVAKLQQDSNAFSQLARERSEDGSAQDGGELGYVPEEELKKTFPASTVTDLMNAQRPIGSIVASQAQNKIFILKVLDRSDRDEELTLESPGIKEQVSSTLISSRKQLLIASYAAVAMNEAKIENLLAKKVVENPNELSGARPAPAPTAATASPAPSVEAAKPAEAKPEKK